MSLCIHIHIYPQTLPFAVEIRFNGHCQIFFYRYQYYCVYKCQREEQQHFPIGPKIEEIRVGLNKFEAGQEKLIKNIQD